MAKKTRAIKVEKSTMTLDEWEAAKDKACGAFVKSWNASMRFKGNRMKHIRLSLEISDLLWNHYSDEVLR